MRPFFLLALRTGQNGPVRFFRKGPKENFWKKIFFWKIWLCHFDQCAMLIGKMVSLFILPLRNPEICQDPSTHERNDQALYQNNTCWVYILFKILGLNWFLPPFHTKKLVSWMTIRKITYFQEISRSVSDKSFGLQCALWYRLTTARLTSIVTVSAEYPKIWGGWCVEMGSLNWGLEFQTKLTGFWKY